VVLWAIALVFAAAAVFAVVVRASPLAPYSWAQNHRLVAHAMGGVDGRDYTNSLEAWEQNYARGYRVFEVDLRVLDDATVVCSHAQPSQATVGEFKATPLDGGYTPLTVDDLAGLMARYPDAWVMTDIKVGRGAPRDSILRTLRSAVSGDPTSRSRIIVQAYEEADWRYARKLGFENIAYSLYHQKPEDLPASVAFAAKNNIRFVGLPTEMVTEDLVKQARESRMWVGAYTVNDEAERSRLEKLGVTHFYSDYLQP
jgi:glycerophosphoryl diester phosphodiesterase